MDERANRLVPFLHCLLLPCTNENIQITYTIVFTLLPLSPCRNFLLHCLHLLIVCISLSETLCFMHFPHVTLELHRIPLNRVIICLHVLPQACFSFFHVNLKYLLHSRDPSFGFSMSLCFDYSCYGCSMNIPCESF